MPAYAVANIHQINVNSRILAYLKQIDATLEAYDGRFLVHGNEGEVVEGSLTGHLIIIEFPDLEHAREWYYSEEYQKILPLRTNNSMCDVVLIDGVAENYKASNMLSK